MKIEDVFGIKPFAEATEEITDAAIKGVSGFLSVVCKPCLAEFGLMLEDRVRIWRLKNLIKVIDKSKGRLGFEDNHLTLLANARVGLSIMEECSSVDDEGLQEMWAGLFASSCTVDGKDDSNMNFVDLLKRMSSVEARILCYACENCQKIRFPNNLILAKELVIPLSRLIEISGTDDIYRLDCELDHMRSIMLLNHGTGFMGGGGFQSTDDDLNADITPSALGLNLYFKTHAVNISPIVYWEQSLIPYNDNNELGQE